MLPGDCNALLHEWEARNSWPAVSRLVPKSSRLYLIQPRWFLAWSFYCHRYESTFVWGWLMFYPKSMHYHFRVHSVVGYDLFYFGQERMSAFLFINTDEAIDGTKIKINIGKPYLNRLHPYPNLSIDVSWYFVIFWNYIAFECNALHTRCYLPTRPFVGIIELNIFFSCY